MHLRALKTLIDSMKRDILILNYNNKLHVLCILYLFQHSRTKKMAKDQAEVSTTIANILGDALMPGLFNLVGCVVSFIAYQYFCFTNFCRVTKNKQGIEVML